MSSQPQRSAGAVRRSPRRTNGARPHVGPVALTPFRIILALGFVGSLAYIAWAILKVKDSAQIPMVTTGIGVLGIVFAAASAGGAVRMWQAWKRGRQAETVLFALLGGIAGLLALGSFAGTLVLSLVWRS
ncbi:MAG: hypothetical protein HYX54_00410 [Chloroflexi bacterium]|nr:hypothetical protein [Chloroflexota bacterium]